MVQDYRMTINFSGFIYFWTDRCHCEQQISVSAFAAGVTLIALLTLVVCNLAGRALNRQGLKEDVEL